MKNLIFITLFLVSCNSNHFLTTKNIKNDISIDSFSYNYKNYSSKVYTFSNKKYLIQNREKYLTVFKEDECLNCATNPIELCNDSDRIVKRFASERKIFDYQYWQNGNFKINNLFYKKNNYLYMRRIEFDSLNNIHSESNYVFVKDTTLINHEFKISGWFEIN